jgi:hypothetical protein
MREVEATFRDASEMTNTRAVWWSIVQIVVLVGAAVWQMRYLKVYFGDKKLRWERNLDGDMTRTTTA